MKRRHQPKPGLREPRPGQPAARQTCPGKFPAVTTSALPHDATKIQGSCPQRSGEALELSQGWLEALLTSHRLIHWTQQILRGHTRILARVYFPRPNNVSHVAAGRTMCHAGIKSARPSVVLSPEPQWVLTLIEPLRPYYLDLNRRSRSDNRRLSIPSTSRTLAARRGEPSTKLLAGLDSPLARAPSRQNPSPRNLWRTGHTGPGGGSPPGSSTNSCPTYGRFQHVRVAVSLNQWCTDMEILQSWSNPKLFHELHIQTISEK